MGTATEYTLRQILDQLEEMSTVTGAPVDSHYVVTALSAVLTSEHLHKDLEGADLHDPKAHASSHQNGGSDEISVEGLSGDLADAQDAKAHDLGGAEHNADTLADLNAKISDATLDDSGDPRDPNAHKTSHAGGGSDKLKYTRQIVFVLLDDPLSVDTNVSASIVYRGPDLTLVRWDFQAATAPDGADLIADANVDGTSIWATNQGNRPTISDGYTSGTGTSFDTATISDGDVLTFDIDQVGSTTEGGQVTLLLEGECNLETD